MNPKFDRLHLIRHFAFCVGALAAYLVRSELRIGVEALWVVGGGALLNFAAFALSRGGVAEPGAHRASAVFGVASWGALISVTDGVTSPFVAGLALEVLLSAAAFRPLGTALVSLCAVGALWASQLWLGLAGAGSALALWTGFLLAMGAAIFLVTHRWHRARDTLAQQRGRLKERLARLERRLEDERDLGRVGENAARLAHGLKNSVHSLRGFVGLIESDLVAPGRSLAALTGLRRAIGDLEALARTTLAGNGAGDGDSSRTFACDPRAVLAHALQEITVAHPGVTWESRLAGTSSVLPISPADLREVILVGLRNAVEAMDGRGSGSLETHASGGEFSIVIRDHGAGIPRAEVPRIFEPGRTTKPDGSGYGLFLARRIVQELGGRLRVGPSGGEGTAYELVFPLDRDEGGSASARLA